MLHGRNAGYLSSWWNEETKRTVGTRTKSREVLWKVRVEVARSPYKERSKDFYRWKDVRNVIIHSCWRPTDGFPLLIVSLVQCQIVLLALFFLPPITCSRLLSCA